MQKHGSVSPLIGGCQAAHYDIMYNSTFMDMNDELFLSNEFVWCLHEVVKRKKKVILEHCYAT